MHPATEAAPAAVYMLADHLDGALAAGEDLLKMSLTWHAPVARKADEITAKTDEERRSVEALKSRELMLVAHVLRSRERAEELARSDVHLKPVAKLYNAGTALLSDVVRELGEKPDDFETGDGIVAYLRSRGLVEVDAAAPAAAAEMPISEEFKIAGRIPLGTLLDLVAMFLDMLETHYDLYDDATGAAPAVVEGQAPAAGAAL